MFASRAGSVAARSLLKQARALPCTNARTIRATTQPIVVSTLFSSQRAWVPTFVQSRGLSSVDTARAAEVADASTPENARTAFPWRADYDYHEDQLYVGELYNDIFARPVSTKTYTHGTTGTYVNLSEEDLKLLPEGLAGESAPEFLLARDDQKRWMIRDAGKLCCRLLDNYRLYEKVGAPAAAVAGNKGNSAAPSASTADHDEGHEEGRKLNFPGLTDRPEWIDSVLKVEHYGAQLLDLPKNSLKASGNRSVAPLDGEDLVEMYMEAVEEGVEAGTAEVPDKILLTGARGVGKSFALNQAVLHARKNGWLCLFIPDGWSQVHGGSYVQPALLESDATNAASKPALEWKVAKHVTNDDELEEMDLPEKVAVNEHTIFDNHEMSAEALRGFWRAHAAQLRKIPLRNPAILNKYRPYRADFEVAFERIKSVEARWASMPFVELRASIEGEDCFPALDAKDVDVLADFKYHKFQGKTLEDLVLLGVALRELSGSLFIDLVNELRALDDPNMPVLIAVDHYNTWEGHSAYSYQKQQIPSKRLCVPYALNFLSVKKADTHQWGLVNGVCIAATSQRSPEGRRLNYDKNKPSVPLSVTVPQYNATEFAAVASYLTHNQFLSPQIELRDLLSMRMFTGSNPRLIREQGVAYLLPRMMILERSNAEHEARLEEQEELNELRLQKARSQRADVDSEDSDEDDEGVDLEGGAGGSFDSPFVEDDDLRYDDFDEVDDSGNVTRVGKATLEALEKEREKKKGKSGKGKGKGVKKFERK